MFEKQRCWYTLGIAFSLGLTLSGSGQENDTQSAAKPIDQIEEIVVKVDPRSLATRVGHGSVTTLADETISFVAATHPNEILSRVPGVWVVRGSGQEHLTGIRSGILAGPGACGAFLLLEDNIPVRPVGFCNVNGLFELNSEQADSIQVLRGPASPLYGGNALHGVINVRTFLGSDTPSRFGLEFGPYDFSQFRMEHQIEQVQVKLHSTATGGYRESTGYGQQKINVRAFTTHEGWQANHVLSASVLNQETGGYVRGFEAYTDSRLRRSNPNPEAHRDATSVRIASHWVGTVREASVFVTPYVRRSSMTFLQHFLPGQPKEKNSQTSLGAIAHWSREIDALEITLGTQLEFMRANLLQQQENETRGSAFLVATRPKGTHYDYEVGSTSLAVFNDLTYALGETGEISQGLRLDYVNYDYENRHLDGNTKDDGSLCGFGGCLYTRPEDRKNNFSMLSARLGYQHKLSEQSYFWGLVGLGHRPPQTTELYRLQSGQSVAELASEKLRSIELGIDISWTSLKTNVAGYFETTENLIFRDSEGMNVSDGETVAQGIEIEIEWDVNADNHIALAGTLADHTYAFTRLAARGERIEDGAKVDSAPSTIANARWHNQSLPNTAIEVEFVYVSSHYINAANTASYDGHSVVNFRLRWDINQNWATTMRISNALDLKYAERADYAFGSYRYFPGMPRQLFLGVAFSP